MNKMFLDPELRPEYKQKLAKIIKSKHLSRAELEKAVAKLYRDEYSDVITKKF